MMMTGERIHRNPLLEAPPWLPLYDQPAGIGLTVTRNSGGAGIAGDRLVGEEALVALQRYLPSNNAEGLETEEGVKLADPPVDAYSCDEFRMYEFKVRRCARGRSHDWTECPFAHPGEKARRRDPRKYHYSGTACPDFRKGNCKKGDSCDFAHGVFECWLHPARYRTQPCKDGTACRRRVCFFAHTSEQLRVLPQQQQQPSHLTMDSYDGSPMRNHPLDAYFPIGPLSSSPTTTLLSPTVSPPLDSPPMSPGEVGISMKSWPVGTAVNEVVASLRKLQLSKVQSMPSSWGGPHFVGGLDSPVGLDGFGFRQGLSSMPSTPTTKRSVRGRWLDLEEFPEWEEAAERVESGRALRAKMYERLKKDSWLEQAGAGPTVSGAPDVEWVSELVN
ncbi:hypothetical protein HPP92_004899 [Vanilla planifolia]|uniref:C3H1-type domain-containing protein n=1 Tax=Vanilla planifolia TaxID=51239 RepID=A0A835VD05_VANPL|nr:hypothetical protein HPP92_005244 [Vanilla planifolia]KAG0493905.1 hypothetical protein HPP92_004899 [Vanilla planifolia]